MNGEQVSPLWNEIADSVGNASTRIDAFREPKGNAFRLAHWSPNEPTFRWFKSYLQVLAGAMSAPEYELYRRLGNTRLGNPLEVEVQVGSVGKRLTVNLDYVLAVEETCFLDLHVPIRPRSIVEIGAGFGRTAHTLLTNFGGIEHYYIIDLPQTLDLSREYLSRVLDAKSFERVVFIDCTTATEVQADRVDLLIQVDGFQEMTDDVISAYYRDQVPKCDFVYLCQPVGKYEPVTAGIEDLNAKQYAATQQLGRTKILVDPWMESSLEPARVTHVKGYLPHGWSELVSQPSRARPYYLHTLYQHGPAGTKHLTTT